MSAEKSMRSVLLSWERLRLAFNVVLLIEGLTLSLDLIDWFGGIVSWSFWIIVFGVTANAWFSFGPLLEIYLIVFRGRGFGPIRYWIFGILLMTGILVVFCLAMMTALAAGKIFV